MNQQQTKYAMERAKGIFAARKDIIKQRHTDEGVTLSLDEKLAALKKGDFTIKKINRDYYGSGYVDNHIVFKASRERSVNEAAIKADTALLTADYNRLIDELVLGDHTTALELLRAFENA